jgi:predicted oxidoreductase
MRQTTGVVPIIGTQQPDRIRESACAATVELTRNQWYEILVAASGEPMP